MPAMKPTLTVRGEGDVLMTLAELAMRVDIRDVIPAYISMQPLQGSADVWHGVCPLEITPVDMATFTISRKNNQFMCSHCNMHGDVAQFLRLYLGIDDVAAYDVLTAFLEEGEG